jgi:hypothetical protein
MAQVAAVAAVVALKAANLPY